jgi:hypothetical protein
MTSVYRLFVDLKSTGVVMLLVVEAPDHPFIWKLEEVPEKLNWFKIRGKLYRIQNREINA